jgi:hypothetical protein
VRKFHSGEAKEHKRPRALILLDGHSSRFVPDLWEECDDVDIDAFCPTSHSTHLVQALDKYVNSEFKRVLKQNLKAFKMDISEIPLPCLLAAIDDALYCAQRPKIIRESFRNVGLVPFSPAKVLASLLEQCPEPLRNNGFTSTTAFPLANKLLTDRGIREQMAAHLSKRRESGKENEDSDGEDEELKMIREELDWARKTEATIITKNIDALKEETTSGSTEGVLEYEE